MSSGQDLVNFLMQFNGYDRSDAALFRNDYASRHGAVFAGHNVPYCDIFVTYGLRHGVGITDFDSAYVPGRVNAASSRGWLRNTLTAGIGDLITFDFDDDGVDDHIAVVIGGDAHNYYTIEGNTSSVSQGNGGMVQTRTRPRSIVSHLIHIPWDDSSGTVSTIDYTEQLRGVQRALSVDDDGVLGPVTRVALWLVVSASTWGGVTFPSGVAATQSIVGTQPDGVWGDASMAAHDRCVEAIQRALGVDDDGVWGPITQAAWERCQARVETA